MRRLLAASALAVGALALFVAATLSRPPAPAFTPLGPAVPLTFDVSGIEGTALELGLARGNGGPLFMQFEVEMDGPSVVAVLNRAGAQHTVAAVRSGRALPDWPFLKTPDGEAVLSFAFENQLVATDDGGAALRVTYAGPDVPLVRAVRVARPTTLPPFLGRALGHDGPVRLEPGTYPIDADGGATLDARRLGGERGQRGRQ